MSTLAATVSLDAYRERRRKAVEPYIAPEGVPAALLVDVDGTLAHMADRHFADWSRVAEDTVNEPIATLVQALVKHFEAKPIFMSGRSDICRQDTEEWLLKHLGPLAVGRPLLMREHGDNRKDAIVKRELFDGFVRDRYDIKYVIDDRNQVVEMWRSIGLTVLQVADGNF